MLGDGYLKRRFINLSNVSKYLYCVICRDIFDDPVRLQCGHTFCKRCIVEWAKMKSGCPICRSYFDVNEMQRDLVGFNMVNELEVYCCNAGCPWKSSLQNLKEHLKQCYFDPKRIPECIRSIISKDEKVKKKKDNTKVDNDIKSSNEDMEENVSINSVNFNTNVSLKARLYHKNRTLMEKVLSKKKKEVLSPTQSLFDFLNL